MVLQYGSAAFTPVGAGSRTEHLNAKGQVLVEVCIQWADCAVAIAMGVHRSQSTESEIGVWSVADDVAASRYYNVHDCDGIRAGIDVEVEIIEITLCTPETRCQTCGDIAVESLCQSRREEKSSE